MSLPFLSVVVIGRNEGDALERCLARVRAMDYSPEAMEVIYADSGSTDGSPQKAAAFQARVIETAPPFSAAKARNIGWRAASGELVLFLDGDTEIEPRFVRNQLPMFDSPTCACVAGHIREKHPEKSIFNRVLELDWPHQSGDTAFCGGNALFRRSVLEKVGGFDESLVAGEEPELCWRIRQAGYSIWHADELMAHHDLDMKHWRQYWRRGVRSGYAYAQVSERLRRSDDPLWLAESRRNLIQATLYQFVAVAAVIASLLLKSAIPVAAAGIVFGAIIARCRMRVRSRRYDALTTWLYAIHSHWNQIPIFWGQVQWLNGQRTR